MAFVVKKSQPKKRYDYDKDGIQFSLFFEFPYKEERSYSKLKAALKNVEDEDDSVGNFTIFTLRTSLKGWEGIVDEENNTISLMDENGKVDEYIQKEVFEQITNIPGVMTDLVTLYMGVTSKN